MAAVKPSDSEILSTDGISLSTSVDRTRESGLTFYYLLFAISGIPALLYQIVWERSLFTIYGVNIESVTVIVTIFMLGLGLGSLAGGRLSARPRVPRLKAFGFIEISIGAFGAASLSIFHRVASFTAGSSTFVTGLSTFFLLLIPTLLMGSTLPLLVEQFVRSTRKAGESVAALYSVNTFGAGAGCFASALFVMRTLGESGSVRLAAALNILVGVTALALARRVDPEIAATPHRSSIAPRETMSLSLATAVAAAAGFISLAYEIIWYRLYSFTSGGAAPAFAKLLAFYLVGIAYGSFTVRDICRKKPDLDLGGKMEMLSKTVLFGSVAGFLVAPALAVSVHYVPYDVTFLFVFIGAAVMGAVFPMLSHAAIDPARESGSRISYLYLSNIIGSALGSFVVGFVIMDHFSTRTTSLFLLVFGVLASLSIAALSRRKQLTLFITAALPLCALIVFGSAPVFSQMYERLLLKDSFQGGNFNDLVENKSGVIAVDQTETVFGGGIYDGRFNTDLVNDTNGIIRAYAIAGIHANPTDVLVIGLSSGSWAQVVVSNPAVEKMTVIEINPGYIPLIRQRPSVASLLSNPKVDIQIDDGRRWLVRNPDRKFDLILMNTTWNWRANVSNLLSVEFGDLLRSHLKQGGIAYYNTTWSGEVQLTGATEFPYALRIENFLAVGGSPVTLDRDLWRRALENYRIDGRPVLDLKRPKDQARLEQVLQLAAEPDRQPQKQGNEIETRAELLARWQGFPIVTDDNMGTEWRGP